MNPHKHYLYKLFHFHIENLKYNNYLLCNNCSFIFGRENENKDAKSIDQLEKDPEAAPEQIASTSEESAEFLGEESKNEAFDVTPK